MPSSHSLRGTGTAVPATRDASLFRLKHLHSAALEQGGDSVSIAMGTVERQLARNPGDSLCRAYKGSLLTLMNDPILPKSRQATYQKAGVSLMIEALAAANRVDPVSAEILYVVGTTLATLPRTHPAAIRTEAAAILEMLETSAGFATLDRSQQVRALTVASCLAQDRGDTDQSRRLYDAAKAIDPSLCVSLFCRWYDMT